MAAKCSSRPPPETIAAIHSAAAPAKLCIATTNNGDAGITRCFEYNDPHAHTNDATTSTPVPTKSIRRDPPRFAGPTSKAIPTKPSSKLTNTRGTGRVPRGLSQSRITSQSDIVATSSAAIPEGTFCSAQLSPPFPMHSSDTPVTAAVHQFPAVGRIPVLIRKIGYRISPTSECRIAAIANGGKLSIAIRIPRKVDPHKMYTAAKASGTQRADSAREDFKGVRGPSISVALEAIP